MALYFDYGRVLSRGDSYRFAIWQLTVDMIKENPLFGAGMGSYYEVEVSGGAKYTGAHNVVLGTLYHLGAVGLALFLLVLWRIAEYAVSAVREAADYFPIAILVFGVVAGAFDLHTVFLNLNREWLIWLLPIALCLRDRCKSELKMARSPVDGGGAGFQSVNLRR